MTIDNAERNIPTDTAAYTRPVRRIHEQLYGIIAGTEPIDDIVSVLESVSADVRSLERALGCVEFGSIIRPVSEPDEERQVRRCLLGQLVGDQSQPPARYCELSRIQVQNDTALIRLSTAEPIVYNWHTLLDVLRHPLSAVEPRVSAVQRRVAADRIDNHQKINRRWERISDRTTHLEKSLDVVVKSSGSASFPPWIRDAFSGTQQTTKPNK